MARSIRFRIPAPGSAKEVAAHEAVARQHAAVAATQDALEGVEAAAEAYSWARRTHDRAQEAERTARAEVRRVSER